MSRLSHAYKYKLCKLPPISTKHTVRRFLLPKINYDIIGLHIKFCLTMYIHIGGSVHIGGSADGRLIGTVHTGTINQLIDNQSILKFS